MRRPSNTRGVFFHASGAVPELGTVFSGRGQAYDREWSKATFYEPLELYRPPDKVCHREGVFVCNDIESIGLCGGLEETILLLRVESAVSWHDLNWSTEISSLVSGGFSVESEAVRRAAQSYWTGKPHVRGAVWEGIADSATVVAVFDYWEDEAVLESACKDLEREAQ